MKADETVFSRLKDWVEPAHPVLVEYHRQLRWLYEHIREQYQAEIDHAFDSVSRQIGFVVTTTAPVSLQIGDGKLRKAAIPEASPLAGTLFESALMEAIQPLAGAKLADVAPGTYELYLIWYDALKLKLRTEWMEPAHVFRPWLEPAHFFRFPFDVERAQAARARVPERSAVVWESHEPAHWFDPGMALSQREAVLITVIDEVYPELQLVERLAGSRQAARVAVGPGVREPAHFRLRSEAVTQPAVDVLSELAAVLRRYGY